MISPGPRRSSENARMEGRRAWTVQVASSGAVTNLNDADIVISGQLLDFSANAKSRLFSTVVNTSARW